MTAARVYLDEDVHPFIVDALRRRGWEALTTTEAANLGQTDEAQIRFAAASGYALLTYNIQDFPRLHYEMAVAAEPHAGIIVATQADPRLNIRALVRLLASRSAESLRDALVYLNNWM